VKSFVTDLLFDLHKQIHWGDQCPTNFSLSLTRGSCFVGLDDSSVVVSEAASINAVRQTKVCRTGLEAVVGLERESYQRDGRRERYD